MLTPSRLFGKKPPLLDLICWSVMIWPLVFLGTFASQNVLSQIHTAPIVVQGSQIIHSTQYPLESYRLYRSSPTGEAIPIPFQIDEINPWGDYVLPHGGTITAKTGNGTFDPQDELAFMGDDVGPLQPPKSWGSAKPTLVFEIVMNSPSPTPGDPQQGAVYLAVFFSNPPPLLERSYVTFDRQTAEVVTSRYRYGFDKENWLVARKIDMRTQNVKTAEWIPLIESTTFYMKADLKYFLTIYANHRSISSQLEAYKTGPIRTIIRISFLYNFLKLNFELGMYTEVSFFSNAIYLPAILYNPIEGKKSLNKGSGFYYGMALRDNPSELNIDTNMPRYKVSRADSFFGTKPPQDAANYWISAMAKDRMLYVELTPSADMLAKGAVPSLYQENLPGTLIARRGEKDPGPLGEGPVNMALHFDMTKLSEGEHSMAFRLYFENTHDPKRLEAFKNQIHWTYDSRRIPVERQLQ